MSTSYLPNDFVARYARPPSDSIIAQAISVHTSVRGLLGDSDYATILQGSYKNDTALWDMNDVDILAVSRNLVSTHFTGNVSSNGVPWSAIFNQIEQKLQADPRYQGKWIRGDKCIRLNTGIKIDIVPAVRIGDAEADPVAIYSFRSVGERKNWPRGHYEGGAIKSGRTNGAFKQTVRLFKRWARCWFSNRKVAPSYYLECLIYGQPDAAFTGNLGRDFVAISRAISMMLYGFTLLPRIAGEGNLLAPDEWSLADFHEFQRTLHQAVVFAEAAISSNSEAQAKANWLVAFNGRQPT